MAKAILEFNLDEQDDQVAHMRALKSTDLALSLWDIDQYLRSQTKYAADSISPEVFTCLIDIRDKLHEIMSNHSINLDELIH
jgi:hypothetical protein